jgi:hypothetical protein
MPNAVASARRAVALDSSHKEARYVLATSLVRMGNVRRRQRELDVYQRLQAERPPARSRQLEIEGLRRDASVSILNGESRKRWLSCAKRSKRDPESAQLLSISAWHCSKPVSPQRRSNR